MPFIATPMKPNQPDNPSHPNWSTIASLILFFHFNALINYLIPKTIPTEFVSANKCDEIASFYKKR